MLWSTLDYRLKDICLYDDYLYMRGGRMKEPYGETVMRIPKTGGEPEILYKNTLGIETYTLYDGQLYILEMSSKPENYKNWSYRICRVENGQAKQIGRGLNFDQALYHRRTLRLRRKALFHPGREAAPAGCTRSIWRRTSRN